MTHSHARPKGQGALEYLLLIGGAILVTTIVLLMAIGGIFPAADGITNDNIQDYQDQVSLNAVFGGGGGPGPSGSDTTPPSDVINLVASYDSPTNTVSMSWSASADAESGIQNYEIKVDSSAINDNTAYTAAGLLVMASSTSYGYNPTADGTFCFAVKAQNGDNLFSSNPSNSVCVTVDNSTPAPPLMALSLTNESLIPSGNPVVSTGKADYTFTWTGVFPSNIDGAFKALIVGQFDDTPTPFGSVLSDIIIAFNPGPQGAVPNLDIPSGTVTGRLSNFGIKMIQMGAQAGLEAFFILGGTTASDGGNYYPASNGISIGSGAASWTWPVDTEPPQLSTPNVATGVTNGGLISWNFLEKPDVYLGAPVADATGNFVFKQLTSQVGYCPSAACSGAWNFSDAAIIKEAIQPFSPAFVTLPLGTVTGNADWSEGIMPSQDYYVIANLCDAAGNCFANQSALVKASKEAKMIEAENTTLTGLVQNAVSHAPETVVHFTSSCPPAGSTFTIPITFNQPASSNVTYRMFVRYGNINGAAGQRLNATLGPSNTNIVLNSTTTGANLVWTSVATFANVPKNTTLTIKHGSGAVPTCTPEIYVDKILITSDPVCVPTVGTDGSNCGSFSP